LLEAIENWLSGKCINKKTFAYDHKQHIQSIETLDGDGKLLIAKRFECDEAGNAILERRKEILGFFRYGANSTKIASFSKNLMMACNMHSLI